MISSAVGMLPSSKGRTRQAVDSMYEAADALPDGPQMAQDA
ncbi:hypothetical protein [Streptomyces sp. NPDC057718]